MERDQITRNIGVDSCPNQTAFVWIFLFNSIGYSKDFFFLLFLTIGALKMRDGVFHFFGKRSKARTWRGTLEQSPWKDSARVDGKH